MRRAKERSGEELRVLRERSEGRMREVLQKVETLEFELGRWKENARRADQRANVVLQRIMLYRAMRRARNESASSP